MNQLKFHTERLRAAGLRPTKQRLTICTLLFDKKQTFHFTIEKLKKILKKEKKKFIAIDGVRYSTNDGWWLVRASNTQNIIVARCEAYSKENLKKIKSNLKKNLKKCSFEVPNF